MAWIVKNSAGTKIDRREEPYLTEAIREHLRTEVLGRYPTKRASTLPALHAVQDAYGWIPSQAIEEIAGFLDLAAAEVLDTATFYEEYFLEPKGRNVVWVCQSISCELRGQETLLEQIKEKLGIEPGQTTEDGRFTLKTAECLGSCGTAPCALVNETLHENLTFEDFKRIVDDME